MCAWCASDQLSEVLVPNMPKVFSFQDPLFRMECTLSCEMPTVLAIYLSLTLLSVITISWTLLTISGIATVTGLPGQGSSSRLCLPRLNSATHLFTVAYEGASFPSVATISLWISLGVKPFLCKYWITALSLTLSVSQKTLFLFALECYLVDINWPNETSPWVHNLI